MNKYPCNIAPADCLEVTPDGHSLRVCPSFGNGMAKGTPILLDREQAVRLARDLTEWASHQPCPVETIFSAEAAARIRLGVDHVETD